MSSEFDVDAFDERAAICEYCGGETRFAAETIAASEQGLKRWEAINEIRARNSASGGNIRQSAIGDATGHMPRVQPVQEKQNGPMSERVVPAGRRGLELPSLRHGGGVVL